MQECLLGGGKLYLVRFSCSWLVNRHNIYTLSLLIITLKHERNEKPHIQEYEAKVARQAFPGYEAKGTDGRAVSISRQKGER